MGINAKELRHGNYILYLNELYVVTGMKEESAVHKIRVFFKTIDGSLRNAKLEDWLNPIPLTIKILEKCGFEAVLTEIRGKIIALYGDYRSGDFVLNSGHNEWWYWSAPLNTKIEYLHQLQNLYYALTNSELNIKL